MAKKISVLSENKQWHTFKGGDVKFYTNPEFRYVEVVRITERPDQEDLRETLAGFHNYIMVKDTSDSVDNRAAPGPVNFDESTVASAPPAIDRYTQAALDSRGKENQAPNFGVLDEKRPIETVTQEPIIQTARYFTPKDMAGEIVGNKADVVIIDDPKPYPGPSPEYLKAGELAYQGPLGAARAARIRVDALLPEEESSPKLTDIIQTFGLKKGSDLLNLPKPADDAAPADAPSASDLEAPGPGSEEMEAIFASVERKWKKDGVGRMNEKQYGEWMGRLEPSELAALITQHQADVKKGLVKMADPADAPPPDLPDSAVEAAKPVRKPRKPRATVKEQMFAMSAKPPVLPAEPETPEETALAKNYQTIAAAEQRHTQRKKKMCVTCHDMGTVPDPQNPENSIMCPSC